MQRNLLKIDFTTVVYKRRGYELLPLDERICVYDNIENENESTLFGVFVAYIGEYENTNELYNYQQNHPSRLGYLKYTVTKGSYLFVNFLYSSMRNHYKNIGTLLLEATFHKSVALKCEGNIRLATASGSWPFYYKFGFKVLIYGREEERQECEMIQARMDNHIEENKKSPERLLDSDESETIVPNGTLLYLPNDNIISKNAAFNLLPKSVDRVSLPTSRSKVINRPLSNFTGECAVVGCSHNHKSCRTKHIHSGKDAFYTLDDMPIHRPDFVFDIRNTLPPEYHQRFKLTVAEKLPYFSYNRSGDGTDNKGARGFDNLLLMTKTDGFVLIIGCSREANFRRELLMRNMNYIEIDKRGYCVLIPKNQRLNFQQVMRQLSQIQSPAIINAIDNAPRVYKNNEAVSYRGFCTLSSSDLGLIQPQDKDRNVQIQEMNRKIANLAVEKLWSLASKQRKEERNRMWFWLMPKTIKSEKALRLRLLTEEIKKQLDESVKMKRDVNISNIIVDAKNDCILTRGSFTSKIHFFGNRTSDLLNSVKSAVESRNITLLRDLDI